MENIATLIKEAVFRVQERKSLHPLLALIGRARTQEELGDVFCQIALQHAILYRQKDKAMLFLKNARSCYADDYSNLLYACMVEKTIDNVIENYLTVINE